MAIEAARGKGYRDQGEGRGAGLVCIKEEMGFCIGACTGGGLSNIADPPGTAKLVGSINSPAPPLWRVPAFPSLELLGLSYSSCRGC